MKIFDHKNSFRFFKYKAANDMFSFERDLLCLYEEKIWFSSPDYLNDPFEGELAINELCEPELQEYRKWISEYNSFGILSLSTVRNNLVLWSHYADSHKGYCIEYYIPGFKGPESKIFGYSLQYIETPPQFNSDQKKFFFGYKHTSWEYEHEYRFVADRAGYFQPHNGSIRAIYLGKNCSIVVRNALETFCKAKGVELFQSMVKKNSYEMDFHPL